MITKYAQSVHVCEPERFVICEQSTRERKQNIKLIRDASEGIQMALDTAFYTTVCQVILKMEVLRTASIMVIPDIGGKAYKMSQIIKGMTIHP